jgi:hypothetical protein
MKAALAIAGFVVACGGGGGTTKPPVTNTGGLPPKTSAVDPWQAVTLGATFTFTTDTDDSAADVITLTATVVRVAPADGGRVIQLEWVENGRPLDAGGPPRTFTVTRDKVRFDDEGLEFPLAREDRAADGREVGVHDDGTVCYTSGPGEGAGDCPDVCFADLCVDPQLGLVSGAGLWWPGYAPFRRSDLH